MHKLHQQQKIMQKTFNEIYKPQEKGLTYESYCNILDDNLVELVEERGNDYWSGLTKKGQSDYIKAHPKKSLTIFVLTSKTYKKMLKFL